MRSYPLMKFENMPLTEAINRIRQDVVEALRGLKTGGSTNYEAGLQQAEAFFAGTPAVRIGAERVIGPADLLYNRGGTRLSEAGAARAREIAEALKTLPTDRPWTLLLTAHADAEPPRRGSAFATNREVALARAANLAQALLEAGVPGGRLVVAAMGDERPLVRGEDPLALAQNRRVEFELLAR